MNYGRKYHRRKELLRQHPLCTPPPPKSPRINFFPDKSQFAEAFLSHLFTLPHKGEAKGGRQKSDQKGKRVTTWLPNGDRNSKRDLPPFAYPLLRQLDLSWALIRPEWLYSSLRTGDSESGICGLTAFQNLKSLGGGSIGPLESQDLPLRASKRPS